MHNIKVVDLEKLNNFHVGHFSFEPYFKSYLSFIVWSLEISEISTQSTFLLPSLLLCSAPPACRRTAHRSGPPPQRHLLPASFHASRPSFLAALALALEASTPRHATPTSPGGCHLDATVDSPGEDPEPFSLARINLRNVSTFYSTRSRAVFPLRKPRTLPPPPWPPSSSELTVAPPPPPFPALNRSHQ